MHPCHFAKTHPDKPAVIMSASGEVTTFRELEERSNQIAHAFRDAGLQSGDTIALFAENSARYFDVVWGAQRAGLYFVCVSSRLTAPEVQYLVEDSGAQIFISGASKGEIAKEVKALTNLSETWSIDGDIEGFKSCLLYTSPSPRDLSTSRMPSSA